MAIKRPRLKLKKGQAYTFDVSNAALATHPFKFTADSGTSEYTTGVTLTGTQGQAGATITFAVDSTAPVNMNYYCGTHGMGMGNHIVIESGGPWYDSENTVTLTNTNYKTYVGTGVVYGNTGTGNIFRLEEPTVSIAWGGARGFAMGGETPLDGRVNDIEYYVIATPGNASDFGNLTQARNQGASASNATRALYASGGIPAGPTNVIDYITCATLGNAIDFGDVTGQSGSEYGRTGLTGVGNGTYGIFMGGQIQSGYGSNVIDRVTIATPGNAADIGNLTQTIVRYSSSTNDATRGVNIGGYNQNAYINVIDYITMANTGNATDFGDLLQQIAYGSRGVISDNTTGVFGGGYHDTNWVHQNVIQKITIQTTANSTDFGDLTAGAINMAATTNGTKGIFTGLQRASGYVVDMEQITIATPGNATDFGDLTKQKGTASGVSGNAA